MFGKCVCIFFRSAKRKVTQFRRARTNITYAVDLYPFQTFLSTSKFFQLYPGFWSFLREFMEFFIIIRDLASIFYNVAIISYLFVKYCHQNSCQKGLMRLIRRVVYWLIRLFFDLICQLFFQFFFQIFFQLFFQLSEIFSKFEEFPLNRIRRAVFIIDFCVIDVRKKECVFLNLTDNSSNV